MLQMEEEEEEEEKAEKCNGAKREVWLFKEQSGDDSCSEIESLSWFVLLFFESLCRNNPSPPHFRCSVYRRLSRLTRQ